MFTNSIIQTPHNNASTFFSKTVNIINSRAYKILKFYRGYLDKSALNTNFRVIPHN